MTTNAWRAWLGGIFVVIAVRGAVLSAQPNQAELFLISTVIGGFAAVLLKPSER
jgi:hypothetical protein